MIALGMARAVVISQSMYFPWVGMLEQVRLADCFVHYDDVQFARGFYNRVQLKTHSGPSWMTVPLRDYHRGQKINEVRVDDRTDWRGRHLDMLRQAYRNARYHDDMLRLADATLSRPYETLGALSRASLLALVEYFRLNTDRTFADSQTLGIPGKGSQRLLDITLAVGGTSYVTGHGALNYLDHELFERAGISVRYMKYERIQYPQLHGAFTPYVTGLDLVANCGREGISVIKSSAVDWREFLRESG